VCGIRKPACDAVLFDFGRMLAVAETPRFAGWVRGRGREAVPIGSRRPD